MESVIDRLQTKFTRPDPPPAPAVNHGVPPAPGIEADPPPSGPPSTWRESQAVVALADFLKPRPWVRLVSFGPGAGYGLHFEDPGLNLSEAGRADEARQVLTLLAEASEDIEHLRRVGRLPLPEPEPRPITRHTWDDDGRRVLIPLGPSGTPDYQGSPQPDRSLLLSEKPGEK